MLNPPAARTYLAYDVVLNPSAVGVSVPDNGGKGEM